MTKNKKRVLIVLLVIVFIIIVLIVAFSSNKAKNNKSYNMVYLSNGEIYIGKLANTMSDNITMTDSYLLKTVKDTVDETKVNFQLSPLKDTIWAPEKLYINKDQVIFYGPLSANSKVGQALMK